MAKIALVTGASRGIGRGTAISLAKQGFDVYVTGRTESNLAKLRNEVEALGQNCTAIACDHNSLPDTVRVFESLENLTFDIVVNNAWSGYELMNEAGQYTWENKFWEQPDHRWQSMIDVGLRTAFICSRHSSRAMVKAGKGLIVNISWWAARKYMQNVIYGISKAAIDKMTADMAFELQPFGVAAISLYPGLVRTELVLENAQYFNMENSESTEFEGLVIGALSRDRDLLVKSGRFHTSAELAGEYGIVDIDGKRIKEERLAM